MENRVSKRVRPLLVIITIFAVICSLFVFTACNKSEGNVTSIEVVADTVPTVTKVAEFDITVIQLKVTYEDGTVNVINAQNAMLTTEAKASLTTEGQKNITLSYGKQTATVAFLLVNDGTEVVTVTFLDENGKTIAKRSAIKGGSITNIPNAPSSDTGDFVSWVSSSTGEEVSFNAVSASISVKANYSSNTAKYTVTFKDYKGNTISKITVSDGEKITAPAFEKPAELKSYAWNWDFKNQTVTGNVTINMTYEYVETRVFYAFTYSSLADSKQYSLNFYEDVKYGATPSKLNDAIAKLSEKGMTFEKWLNLSDVQNNSSTELVALVKPRTYSITYTNGDYDNVVVNSAESYLFPTSTSITKTGMQFVKKWKDTVTGVIYNGGETLDINSDMKLVGVYEPKSEPTEFTAYFDGLKADDQISVLTIVKSVLTTRYGDIINREYANGVLGEMKKSNSKIADYEIDKITYSTDGVNYTDVGSNGTKLTDVAGSQHFRIYCVDREAGSSGLGYAGVEGKEEYYVLSYAKSGTDDLNVIIPAKYNGKPVVGIGPGVFSAAAQGASLKMYITMPDTIRFVKDSAFAGVEFLSNVSFPALTEIASNAFKDVIGNVEGGITISVAASSSADKLTEIGASAFEHLRGVKAVSLPDTVTKLGDRAFYGCADLVSVTVNKVVELGSEVFANCTGLEDIGALAEVTKVGNNAFSFTKIGALNLPKAAVLGEKAFADMEYLKTLSISASAASGTSISFAMATMIKGDYSLKELILGNGVTAVVLRNLAVVQEGEPADVITDLEIAAFKTEGAKFALNRLALPKLASLDVNNINVFPLIDNLTIAAGGKYTAVNSVIFTENTLIYYPCGVFGDYETPATVAGKDVTAIADGAFTNVVLNKLALNAKVTTVGKTAIGGVNVVQMPKELMDALIAADTANLAATLNTAFTSNVKYYVTGVASDDTTYAAYNFIVTDASKIPTYFDAATKLLYSLDADGKATVLSGDNTASVITVPAKLNNHDVVALANGAFEGFKYLETLNILATLNNLDIIDAFNGCVALKTVTLAGLKADAAINKDLFNDTAWYKNNNVLVLANRLITYNDNVTVDGNRVTVVTAEQLKGVTFIPADFFKNTHLTSVTLADSVVEIGDNAFENTQITDFILNKVVKVGTEAFAKCALLRTFTASAGFNNGQMAIGMFVGCSSLEGVNVPGITDFLVKQGENAYSGAFKDCVMLSDVDFLGQFVRIPDSAFENCKSITKLNFYNFGNIASIGNRAFYGCTALENVVLNASVKKIGTQAFFGCDSLISLEVKGTGGVLEEGTVISYEVFPDGMKIYVDSKALTAAQTVFGNYSSNLNTTLPVISFSMMAGYEVEGKTLGIESVETTYIASAPVAPAFSGYIFDGWYVNGERAEFPMTFAANTVFSAKYYNLTAGSVKVTDVEFYDGNQNSYKLVKCDDVKEVYIPAIFGDKPIVCVDLNAFDACRYLENIVLPEGVKYIVGSINAVVKKITIPSTVVSIADGAFANASGLDIVFAENSALIDAKEGAFEGSKWYVDAVNEAMDGKNGGFVIAGRLAIKYAGNQEKVTLPGQVLKLSDSLFLNNNVITEIVLNDALEEIGADCFKNAAKLSYVTYETDAASSSIKKLSKNAFNGTPWLAKQNLAIVGTILIKYNDKSGDATVNLPGYVKQIIDNAFENATLTGISFNASKLESIGNYAFRGSSLTSISLPETVVSLGDYAFADCVKLITADLHSANIESLPEYAFDGCSKLITLSLGGATAKLGSRSLRGCLALTNITADGLNDTENLYGDDNIGASGLMSTAWAKSSAESQATHLILGSVYVKYSPETGADVEKATAVTIPEGVKVILQNAFGGLTYITEVGLPASVEQIRTDAFNGCSELASVTFAEGSALTAIENKAFYKTGLTSISLPANLQTIGDSAFYGTKLVTVTIPDSVVSIGVSAFRAINALRTVKLGVGMEKLGEYAFADNESLYKVEWNLETVKLDEVGNNETTVKQLYAINANVNAATSEILLNTFIQTVFARTAGFDGSIAIRMYVPNDILNLLQSKEDTDKKMFNWTKANNFRIYAAGDYPQVVFDTQNGYYMENLQTEVITELATPAKTDSTFMGWYLDDEHKTPLVLPYYVYEGVNVYAKWYSNNRTGGETDEALTYGDVKVNGETVGYTIDSIVWSKNKADMQYVSGSEYVYDVDYTLYVPATYSGKKVIGFNMADGKAPFVSRLVFTKASNIAAVDKNIFAIFPNLKEVVLLGGESSQFQVKDSVVYNADLTKVVAYLTDKDTVAHYNDSTQTTVYSYTYNNKVTEYAAPLTVKEILPKAFAYSNLTSVTLTKNVAKIGANAFNDGLTTVVLDKAINLTDVTRASFANTVWYNSANAKQNYTVNGSTVGIFYAAGNILLEYDEKASTTILELPTSMLGFSITVIASNLFDKLDTDGVSSFTETVLPLNVAKINSQAFLKVDTANVRSPKSYAKLVDIADDVFGETTYYNNNSEMLVLGKILLRYVTSATSVTVDEGIIAIANDAFANAQIESIKLPSTLKSIGANAFYGCNALASVTIPDNVTEIGSYVFENCINLTSVTFNVTSKLTGIGAHAFYNCKKLASFKTPYTVLSIGDEAFAGCVAMSNITFDLVESVDNNGVISTKTTKSNLTELGVSAFEGCQKLTSVSIPDNVTAIKEATFKNCSALVNAIFDASLSKVKVIGKEAFYGCKALGGTISLDKPDLVTVVLPNAVVKIEESAFEDCSGMYGIKLNYNVASIAKNVFLGCYKLAKIVVYSSTPAAIDTESFVRDRSSDKKAYYSLRIYVPNNQNDYTYNNYKNHWSAYAANIYHFDELPTLTYRGTYTSAGAEASRLSDPKQVDVLVNPTFTWPSGVSTSAWKYYSIAGTTTDSRLNTALDAAEYRKQTNTGKPSGYDTILVIDANMVITAAIAA